MPIDGFGEIINTIYIAKKLYDMGKYHLVEESLFNSLCYDNYYENMYSLMENIFEHHYCTYFEKKGIELHIHSDAVMVDFFVFAGEYGKRNNLTDEMNPYVKAANEQAIRCFNFSYCVDFILQYHTEPKRPFHSRLGILISEDDYVDLGQLALGLVSMYEWFDIKCKELKDLLYDGVITA